MLVWLCFGGAPALTLWHLFFVRVCCVAALILRLLPQDIQFRHTKTVAHPQQDSCTHSETHVYVTHCITRWCCDWFHSVAQARGDHCARTIVIAPHTCEDGRLRHFRSAPRNAPRSAPWSASRPPSARRRRACTMPPPRRRRPELRAFRPLAFRPGGAGPGGGSFPDVCCSRRECDRPRAVCQRR